MGESAPTSYDEVIDVLERLPLLVRETRRRRGLSQRAASAAAGLDAFSTISRCENGAELHQKSIVALLRWLGTPDTCPHCGSATPREEETPLIGTDADPEFRAHARHKHPVAGCGYCPEEEDR